MTQHAVVAGEVVVSHGQTCFIVLREGLRFPQQVKCLLVFLLLEQIEGQNVANVADLYRYCSELSSKLCVEVFLGLTSRDWVPKLVLTRACTISSLSRASLYLPYRELYE